VALDLQIDRHMKIRQIMTTDVMTVAPDDGLTEAANVFLWTGIRHLPVVMQGRVVGVLTQRDLASFQAHHPEDNWKAALVDRAMHSPVETAGPDDSVTEAAARMREHRLGCLPITRYGKLVGVVTTSDILAAHVEEAMHNHNHDGQTVKQAMTPKPQFVHPDDSLLDAAARMQQNGVRHLPVVDGDMVVLGMLSDRDIRTAIGDPTRALKRERGLSEFRVSQAMNHDVQTVSPSDSCAEVAMTFAATRADAAPVVNDQNQLVGILSYVDLLRALSDTHTHH
jgi:CBS domain-containing protein